MNVSSNTTSIQFLQEVSVGHFVKSFVETRRLRGDQIEVFKILNGYENIDSNLFSKLKKVK